MLENPQKIEVLPREKSSIHGDNQQVKIMDKTGLIWLAGFFEGEGTTGIYQNNSISKGKYGSKLITYFHIVNTDPLLIEKVQNITNDLGINLKIYLDRRPTEKHAQTWRIVTKKMIETYILLKTIYPYLAGQKRAIAAITMKFIESRDFGRMKKGPGTTYSDNERKLYQVCRELNQRGPEKKRIESSETVRQTLKELLGEDIVRTLWKHEDNTKA